MLATLHTATVVGVDAWVVDVEVDVAFGLPSFTIVGLPDSAVRESRDRVRSAIRYAGFEFPIHRVTVNLAPSDIRKTGTAFDLPIAIGVLAAAGFVPRESLDGLLVVGGLSLDGRVQRVRGILPVTMLAARRAVRLVLPEANVAEAALVAAAQLVPAHDLARLVSDLASGAAPAATVPARSALDHVSRDGPDLADVRGQPLARRALEIAAAGRHNILLVGPPGTGKTLLARRLPGILPPPSLSEVLASTSIHSVAGVLDAETGPLRARPFRAPHHTVSAAALIGGGTDPRPGEVSLAHTGVLFLDEIVEFGRGVLETLREPVEEGTVRIARIARAVQFPARFLLVAAMNPCPCGYAGEASGQCRCSVEDIARYQRRLSGPLRDRMDLTVRVESVPFQALAGDEANESSAQVAARVTRAYERQLERYARDAACTNADLSGRQLLRHCVLDQDGMRLLERAVHRFRLTGRGFDRVRRVARTIADLDEAPVIRKQHLAEALQYRVVA